MKEFLFSLCVCAVLAAAYLLASLVPSQTFRQGFRTARPIPSHYKEILNSPDAQSVLHKVLGVLYRLLKPCRHYADVGSHGTSKLTAYFTLLSYCCITTTEKLMVSIITDIVIQSFILEYF